MVAIEVQLLTGNYVATEFNERNRAEWPPHPARLFAALVATWADADEPDEDERRALTALEKLSPPTITCDLSPAHRTIVTHYVPDNDVSATNRDLSSSWAEVDKLRDEIKQLVVNNSTPKDRAKAEAKLAKRLTKLAADSLTVSAAKGNESLAIQSQVVEVLPSERGRQARTYPVVIPESPIIRFVWEDDLNDTESKSIDGVCSRLSRLGHSSSLVSARVVSEELQDTTPTFVLGESRDSQPIRVTAAGMLDRLEYEFQRHQGCEPRVTVSKTARYQPAKERNQLPSSILSGEWISLPWPNHQTRPYVTRTLALTRAFRGALMEHGDQPSPSILSGHTKGTAPTAPMNSPHASFLALPSAGYEHSDGRIMGLGILLPRNADADEVAGVYRALSGWLSQGGRLNPIDGKTPTNFTSDQSELPVSIREERWAGHRNGHRRWVSVTPIALDRYPDAAFGTDERLAEAALIVANSCAHVGLPAPVSVETTYQPLITGSRPVQTFSGLAFGRSGAKRAAVHATIEFAEPIAGPLILGAGRYLGYGLFAPISEDKN
jgi:CRISPR-associated protein Csb2